MCFNVLYVFIIFVSILCVPGKYFQSITLFNLYNNTVWSVVKRREVVT